MSGPVPKPAAIRQRRNKTSTSAKLPGEKARTRAPALPRRYELVHPLDGTPSKRIERPWHALTKAWWADVWASPMTAEYLQSDVHGLFILAELVDRYWEAPTKELAAEIRQQRAEYGLSPIARRRLQWEVERAESVVRKRAPSKPTRQVGEDPRQYLVAVK